MSIGCYVLSIFMHSTITTTVIHPPSNYVVRSINKPIKVIHQKICRGIAWGYFYR